MVMLTRERDWVPLGYARFGDLSSAVNLGTATPTAGTAYSALGAVPRFAVVSIESQSVRVRDDGTAPEATEGELCAAGEKFSIGGADAIKKLTAIQTAASAAMTVRYYL
jgi:hypothetical protein